MERLTDKNWKEIENHCYAKGIHFSNQFTEEQTDEMVKPLAELEDKLENGQLVELPKGWLDTLKLLTVAAMCYADIKDLIESRIKGSKDISDLYFKCPNVQGSTNLWALSSLAESKLDCNKIKGFEEILNAMPNFKEIINRQS